MNRIITAVILFISLTAFSQEENYNLKKGAVANGYDVVAYFSNKAVKGSKKLSYTYDDVVFQFSSTENLNTFKANPKKYIPQYGGYCAYAIGVKGEKVGINPKTFEIRDGKLYLFYNSWGTNTLKLWLDENPEELKVKADKNWLSIKK
ncbi:YHS domain-containing (seleno)protein [Tenacibaculum sp. MEBiC06402]|uniref:YHS domain-containing (seleno)protein n=1 Tax=unclassified Tenacibaculum TaxID=2635139 RepID=UPI003B9BF15C